MISGFSVHDNYQLGICAPFVYRETKFGRCMKMEEVTREDLEKKLKENFNPVHLVSLSSQTVWT